MDASAKARLQRASYTNNRLKHKEAPAWAPLCAIPAERAYCRMETGAVGAATMSAAARIVPALFW